MKTGTLHLRCPVIPSITLSIFYEIDEEGDGQTNQMYTTDPHAIDCLKRGLLYYVYWPEPGMSVISSLAEITFEKLEVDHLMEHSGWVSVNNFGYTGYMSYVWVSPEAVCYLGEEMILKILPHSIKLLASHEELMELHKISTVYR